MNIDPAIKKKLTKKPEEIPEIEEAEDNEADKEDDLTQNGD